MLVLARQDGDGLNAVVNAPSDILESKINRDVRGEKGWGNGQQQ